MNRRPHQKVVSIEDMSEQELIEFAKVLEAEMSDDLKPCPFCGGEPFSFEDYGHSTAWEVGCSNSQCRVEPNVWEKTRDEALASWNTRTPDTGIEALTEQLEAARADAKEAEAYAEELEKEIELNEQEACMLENDFIKADKEIDALKAKLEKTVELLKEARQDLEEYVTHEWPKDEHPVYERKWERDMELCRRIDATLAEIEMEIAAHKGKAEVHSEARTYWSDYEEYCVIAEIENSEAVTLGEQP